MAVVHELTVIPVPHHCTLISPWSAFGRTPSVDSLGLAFQGGGPPHNGRLYQTWAKVLAMADPYEPTPSLP